MAEYKEGKAEQQISLGEQRPDGKKASKKLMIDPIASEGF